MKTNQRKNPTKCRSPYCRNDKPHGYFFCHKCRSRKYKESQPVSYFWNALNNNARAQGRVVNLSREEYTGMWEKHNKKESRK